MQGGVFFFSLRFKSFREWVLCNVYSCEISFPSGHRSGVIPVALSLEAGGDFLYFTVLVMVFPRHVLGTYPGQSEQGQVLRGSVTGRSESGHLDRVGFALFALNQESGRCNAQICP